MASTSRRRTAPVPRVTITRRDEIFANDGLCRGGSRLVRGTSSSMHSLLLEPCVDGDPKGFELGDPTDQDGCASQIFDYMWARNPGTARACPNIRLPHTIVFKHGQVRINPSRCMHCGEGMQSPAHERACVSGWHASALWVSPRVNPGAVTIVAAPALVNPNSRHWMI